MGERDAATRGRGDGAMGERDTTTGRRDQARSADEILAWEPVEFEAGFER
jgi:hypothetical protein